MPLKSFNITPFSSVILPEIVTVSKALIVSEIDVVFTLYFG